MASHLYRILENPTHDSDRCSLKVVPRLENSPPIHQTYHNRFPASRSQTKSVSLQDDASKDTRRRPSRGITPQRPRSTASTLASPTPLMRPTQSKVTSAGPSNATGDSVPEDEPQFVRQDPNQRTPSQRPLSAAPSQESPVLLQRSTTVPISRPKNAAISKSRHTLSDYFQRERGVIKSLAAQSRVSRLSENDLVQQGEQAKNRALQVVIPRHRQPPTNLSSFILSSFLPHPFPSRSLPPPIVRVTDTSTPGASAIDGSLQLGVPVPLHYFKDGKLVSSRKLDQS